jgi:dihydroxyacetone kinase
VRELLQRSGEAWSETAGGPSGALWGGLLRQLGESLGSPEEFRAHDVATPVTAARARVSELGGASPGDKTILDAMVPFETTLAAELEGGADPASALGAAAAAARKGVDATSAMTPRRGRARPLAERGRPVGCGTRERVRNGMDDRGRSR